jgi:hypothetical protein
MIHLVTPEVQGGVYDFARILQAEIGPDIAHLVPLPKGNTTTWKIRAGDSVVLQMSGYGFSKRGAPLWLLREIEMRRKEINKFGVFFHELYAFGPPWKKTFWVSPAQRYVVRRLAEMSDFWMANREDSAQWLRQYAGHKPHAVLPVFSTVGVPKSLPIARKHRLVVFGSTGLRTVTYRAAGREFFQWTKQQSIEIHDVGSSITDPQMKNALTANDVIQHGRLEADNISDLMRDARFGAIAYPVAYIAKSSVFAAYCAHGLCPVVLSEGYAPSDGLLAGQHYLPGVPTEIVDADKAQQLGEGAWEWYQSHTIACHGNALRYFLDLR